VNTVNLALKAELIKRFGTHVEAAQHMGIRENRLSYIVRGHVKPSKQERQALENALRRGTVQRLLKNKLPKESHNGKQ